MGATPDGTEPPILTSGERRIADRRAAPAKASRVTFAQIFVIFKGSLKVVVGGYFLLILAWRSYRPEVALFPVWVAGMFGAFFVLTWIADGVDDIRRAIRG